MGEIVIEDVDAGAPAAVAAVERYVAELVERFPSGFDPGAPPASDEAVAPFRPPRGLFLVARRGEETLGCGAVQYLDSNTAEIKRMWVSAGARGLGLGRRLLAALEDVARAAGRTRVVLDTQETLVEARSLYASAGYTEIERYNDNPYATHFFAKDL
jgi:GNAT superfamily N-acetyltransferase